MLCALFLSFSPFTKKLPLFYKCQPPVNIHGLAERKIASRIEKREEKYKYFHRFSIARFSFRFLTSQTADISFVLQIPAACPFLRFGQNQETELHRERRGEIVRLSLFLNRTHVRFFFSGQEDRDIFLLLYSNQPTVNIYDLSEREKASGTEEKREKYKDSLFLGFADFFFLSHHTRRKWHTFYFTKILVVCGYFSV